MIPRLLIFLLLTGSASAQNVVHYTTTNDSVKYLFATAEPVARLHSGDILDTNTLDSYGNALRKPGDTLSKVKAFNPLARVWFYHINHQDNTAMFKALDSDFSVKIPLHPFLGCIGVAPADGEARSSVVPAEFGGNMDSPEASGGNTVYFPVNAKGGLLYLGDGHAAMGDGEIAGSAIEVPLKARVQLSVIKGRTIRWPQFENDDAIMTVGAYRPIEDAARIALTELVHWIHRDYGLSEPDAYELLSEVARIHFNEMVDPNYVVVASIEKKYLPARKKP